MTPDRIEHTPDEPENGVLSDTGSMDTTGLGILGGATAQVNVELPSESDDDREDDGVIDDEVPFVIEIPADADLPVIEAAPVEEFPTTTTEAEIVENPADLEEWTVEGDGFAPAPLVEDIADAEIVEVFEAEIYAEDADVVDEAEPDPVVEAEPVAEEPTAVVEDLEPLAEEPISEVLVSEEPEVVAEEPEAVAEEPEAEPVAAEPAVEEFTIADFDAADFEVADFDGEFDPAEFDLELADDGVEAALAENAATGDDVSRADDTAEEPMSAKTPADDDKAAATPAPGAPPAAPARPSVPAAAAAAKTATGQTPATRREANHTGAQPVVERTAVERAGFPRADVALTSKRLGEFEAGRETADLLTADRLLDPHQVIRPEPEGAWQHFVYSISGKRINLGDSKRAKARKDLDRRIATPLTGGARFVPVLSRKGGVGKTTVTTLLGQALADARDDRVIAIDANPDRGTLAERITRDGGKTVRDLVRMSPEVVGFNDLSSIVARDETRLDVVASDTDPRVSEAFNDADYRNVAALAAHYYSVVLTDTGTGIVHSVMGATLDLADQIVIVAGLSVDEARLASETLTWLETNGYSDKVRSAVVVLNNARPGHPLVQLDELESHFRTRVRAVVRVPYDPHIAAGSAIVFRELQPATREAARQLAATVVEGLRSLASAA
ncbi:MinD/ParA family ATP-binding protein [Microbacterium trichothecenolyticum]|uniref:CobQ/CobB/MinD/ParA nucleotide binding domain protein n=1 Tax=Microbacterium trichothecenolyticum TaxID=69370 RepID=A0A0M2H7Z3_MICTR|nr:MinD/ParA family protein [Microbacterium trichothecenolyticum]KJL42511.1 CobQ/CobB/MinD/ParA nucleotide binding domain protein [Microbacterium trichothecenolyticum]